MGAGGLRWALSAQGEASSEDGGARRRPRPMTRPAPPVDRRPPVSQEPTPRGYPIRSGPSSGSGYVQFGVVDGSRCDPPTRWLVDRFELTVDVPKLAKGHQLVAVDGVEHRARRGVIE